MTEHARHAPLASVTGSSANGIAKYEESPVEGDDALSGRLNASPGGLAHETATLALVVAGLRALRGELARAACIDALGTPASYRLATEMLDTLTGDLAAMLDGRDFADVDREVAA